MTPADLKAIRAKLKLTLDQLGEKLGTTGRTIRRYEAGERKIPKHVDIMLAFEGLSDKHIGPELRAILREAGLYNEEERK